MPESDASSAGFSRLAFGCGPSARTMTSADPQTRTEIVSAALDGGIDLFDTAAIYGDGLSETNLGIVLAELGAHPRVSSKVFYEDVDGEFGRPVHEGFAHESLRGSLSRLGRDHVDALFMHNRLSLATSTPRARRGPGPEIGIEEFLRPDGILDRLTALKSDGLTEGIGITGLGSDPAAMLEAVLTGRVDLLTYDVNLATTSAAVSQDGVTMLDVALAARERDVPLFALRVLDKGTFVGALPTWEEVSARYPGIENLGVVPARDLWAACDRHSMTLSQFATAFVLSLPWVTTVIGGFTELQHLREALDAAALVDGDIASTRP